jgi:hypothetical protein
MSLARRHRDRVLAAGAAQLSSSTQDPQVSVEAASAGVSFPPAGAATAAAQIGLRLTHDLRRLKEIKSVDAKIAAKREMLPEYRDWVLGLLDANAGVGTGLAAEVLPTMMVWLIDVGAYDEALDLLPFLLRHNVPMPARYQRDAATIAIEEIADAAIRADALAAAFPVEVLARLDDLTAGLDVHDPVRAKLAKAIGIHGLALAEELSAEDNRYALEGALRSLMEAQRLNDRSGVKDKIRRAEKLLAALNTAGSDQEPA